MPSRPVGGYNEENAAAESVAINHEALAAIEGNAVPIENGGHLAARKAALRRPVKPRSLPKYFLSDDVIGENVSWRLNIFGVAAAGWRVVHAAI